MCIVQLHCCGVNNVTDWSKYNKKGAANFNFKGGYTKPLGCCMLRRDGTEITGKDVDVGSHFGKCETIADTLILVGLSQGQD